MFYTNMHSKHLHYKSFISGNKKREFASGGGAIEFIARDGNVTFRK